MMMNKQPWQAIVNTTNLPNGSEKLSNLTVAGTKPFAVKSSYPSFKSKTRRYSFDDNGGSYKGL
ncbi:MAG: hypothetical protein M3Y85_02315 [Bacteroidota bacterium]|nr:hypothetical protein [Bacteroidota bacterium]